MSWASGLSRWLPWPFVGVALLLTALILVTPVLLSNGQPAAGSIFSQAELIIDGLAGNATVHFYVHGLSTSARYSYIHIGLSYDVNWSDPFGGAPILWSNWTNASNVLVGIDSADEMPVALNISALYVANGVSALYVGVFALNVTEPPSVPAPLLTVLSGTPGVSGETDPFADLPTYLLLAYVGSGGTS